MNTEPSNPAPSNNAPSNSAPWPDHLAPPARSSVDLDSLTSWR